MVEWQNIDIPFRGGLGDKFGDLVKPGQLLETAKNIRQRKSGEIIKRYGYEDLGRTVAGVSGNDYRLNDVNSLHTIGTSELVAFGDADDDGTVEGSMGAGFYKYSDTTTEFHRIGLGTPSEVRVKAVANIDSNQQVVTPTGYAHYSGTAGAKTPTHYVYVIPRSGSNKLEVRIYDAAGNYIPPQSSTANVELITVASGETQTGAMSVFTASQNEFVIWFINSTDDVAYYRIDMTQPQLYGSETVYNNGSTFKNITVAYIDDDPDQCIIAYEDSVGATIEVDRVTNAQAQSWNVELITVASGETQTGAMSVFTASQNEFVIWFINSTDDVAYYRIDMTQPQLYGSETVYNNGSTFKNITVAYIDDDPDQCIIAYEDSVGATIEVDRVTNAQAQSWNTQLFTGALNATTGGAVALVVDTANTKVHVFHEEAVSGNVYHAGLNLGTGAVEVGSGGDASDTTITGSPVLTAALDGQYGSEQVRVFVVDFTNSPTSSATYLGQTASFLYDVSGQSLDGNKTHRFFNTWPVGQAFTYNDRAYVWLSYQDPTPQALLLLATTTEGFRKDLAYLASDGEYVAKALDGRLGNAAAATVGHQSQTYEKEDGKFAIVVPRRVNVLGADGEEDAVEVEVDLRPDPIPSQQVGQTLSVGGGINHNVGDISTENGWHVAPYIDGTTIVTGGGNMTGGSYSFKVVYVWTDSAGQVHRSSPSNADVPGSDFSANDRYSTTIYNPHFTNRDVVKCIAEVYITTGNGSIHYYTTSVELTNALTKTLSNQDPGSDTTILAGATLYTDLGELPAGSAPPTTAMATNGERIVCIPSDNRRSIRYTKPKAVGIAPEWPIEFEQEITTKEELTAIAYMDGRWVLFSPNEIFWFGGKGPNANGIGVFSSIYKVPSASGCVDRGSILEVEEGIIYKARKGFYLLDRSLRTKYLGAGVEEDNYSSTITKVYRDVVKCIAEVYITTGNGSIHYYTTSVELTNALTKTLSNQDPGSDTTILAGATLYTDLGELPAGSAPPTTAMATNGERIVCIPSDNRRSIRYTKPKAVGIAPEWPIEFEQEITTKEELTAIAYMDGRWVLFSPNEIFWFGGKGPNANGIGVFSSIYKVPSASGCVDRGSILEVEEGIIYKARKGFYLLDRSLRTKYLGAGVEEDNYSSTITKVYRATKSQDDREYRFLVGTDDDTDATWVTRAESLKILVYDNYHKQWYEDVFETTSFASADDATIIDMVARDSTNYMVARVTSSDVVKLMKERSPQSDSSLTDSSVGMFKDLWTSGTDGENPEVLFETGWMAPGGLNGYVRTRRVGILGEFHSATHTLKIDVFTDGDTSTAAASKTFTVSASTTPYQYRVRLDAGKQKCSRIKVRVTLDGTDAQNNTKWATINAVTLEVGMKTGIARQPAGRTA